MAITEWEIRRTAVGQGAIRILLCDDDPEFQSALYSEIQHAFERLNMRCAISRCHSPKALTPALLTDCDMAFLDIDFESEDENGIDIARALRRVNSHALIFFVTNYIDYAPAGYEVQAFRYILKRDMDQVLERYILQALESMADDLRVLRLRDREENIDLPLDQISYLEVLGHSVSIHAGETAYTMSATLTSLETELEAHGFLRIHKSYLVNMQCIRKFRSRECLLTDGTTLAVSEKNYSQQKQKYLLWKGLH
jgi:DNA-binding LytR/AlgR family response regulator